MSSNAPSFPLIRMLRPTQWTKNAVVFAALVFGRPAFADAWLPALIAFVSFCAMSSATYLANDVVDRDRDRLHPRKRLRPIAAGLIEPGAAIAVALVLAGFSLSVSWLATPRLTLVLAVYGAMMVAYTWLLKCVVLLDVFVISAGFVLRAVAGAVAVSVPVSNWLLLCTFLLALFLAFGKRRNELMTLVDAGAHRPVLLGYTAPFLDLCIAVTASTTILAYSMYTFTSITVPRSGAMMVTIPIVIFAVLRYLYQMYVQHEGGAPESLLWRDRTLLGSILVWGLTVVGVLLWA